MSGEMAWRRENGGGSVRNENGGAAASINRRQAALSKIGVQRRRMRNEGGGVGEDLSKLKRQNMARNKRAGARRTAAKARGAWRAAAKKIRRRLGDSRYRSLRQRKWSRQARRHGAAFGIAGVYIASAK